MKLARLLDDNLHAALKSLSQQKLPAKAAFALKGLQKKINEELVKYEEVRKDLLQQCGQKGADGHLMVDENNTVEFTEEGRSEFIKELNELVNTEIEVGTITLAILGEKVELSADDAQHLDGILVE